MIQARAYIIKLLILSLSLSASARPLAGRDAAAAAANPHDFAAAQQALQQAGLGLGYGGRPAADGLQAQGTGAGIAPRFQQWAAQYPNLAPHIPELDRRVQIINSEQEEETRKKMFPELISWIQNTLGDKAASEDLLYSKYCVHERTLAQQQSPQGNNPANAQSQLQSQQPEGSAQTENSDLPGGEGSSNSNPAQSLVSPVRRNPEQGGRVGDSNSDLREAPPTPVRTGLLARNFGEIPTPSRRIDSEGRPVDPQGRPIGSRNSRYNPDGCQPSFNGIQTPQQGEENRNPAADSSDPGEEEGSPNEDRQPPNFTPPQGGGGSGSKGQPLKGANIPDPQPYPAMPGAAQVDGSCPFCSAISEAGRSKFQYNGAATVQGIGKDLDEQRARREEIMAKSSFIPPRAMNQPNQRPRTGDALSSASKKNGGSFTPFNLQSSPNL